MIKNNAKFKRVCYNLYANKYCRLLYEKTWEVYLQGGRKDMENYVLGEDEVVLY